MTRDEQLWLNKFFAANRLNKDRQPLPIPSHCSRRRHNRILEADQLAIIVTNYRLLDGQPQERFSR